MSGTTPKQFSRDVNSRNDESTSDNSVLEPSRSQAQRPQDDTTLVEDSVSFQPGAVNSIPEVSACTDTSGTSTPGPIVLGTNAHQWPYKFHIGIFSSNLNAARRFKQHVNQRYSVCIYDEWLDRLGEPIPEKCLPFIKECLLIFWIASPGGDTGYMNRAKNLANHNCITRRRYTSFIVVIPKEHLDLPTTEIVPEELQAFEPIEEDDQIGNKIESTVRRVLTMCQGYAVNTLYSLSAQHQEQPQPLICAEVDRSSEPDSLSSDQQRQKNQQQDLAAKPSHVTYNIEGANTVVISNEGVQISNEGTQNEMEQHENELDLISFN